MDKAKENPSPFVSVIMPICNEEEFIATSLSAVLNQDYSLDCMEIIIVDGMSVDKTREVISNLQIKNPKAQIYLLDNPSRIVPTALNIGLKRAKGEVIIRIDGHCEIAPDYVRCSVEIIKKTGADCVGGFQRAVGRGVIGETIALAMSSPFGVGNARFHYAAKPEWTTEVYLGSYQRSVFERIGNFDEELMRSQDSEFEMRLIEAGGKIWLDPSIRSVYYTRQNLRSLWLQYFYYGVYRIRVIQKRRIIRYRQLIPPVFVSAFILSSIVALFKRQPVYLASVIIPYVLINAMFSISSARKKLRLAPLLFMVFFILHFAWGTGFIYGLWKWKKFWFIIQKPKV